jgi:small-conductance mechanosensitive channel
VSGFGELYATYGPILERLGLTLGLVAFLLLVRVLLRRLIASRFDDPARRYGLNKAVGGVVGVLAVVSLLAIWVQGSTGLAAYFGILSAGLAIALQDPLTNMAGWIFILARRPFSIGDRIQIGDHAGDVVDIRLFQFTINEIGNWVDADQSTGRIIHVPNGQVFRSPTANYTQEFNFIWDELPVTVTFESDWRAAKEILDEIVGRVSAMPAERASSEVRKAATRYRLEYKHLTPIVWTAVADIGVTLTMRYLVEPRRRRGIQTQLWEEVLTAFAQRQDIDFAYPTVRYYDNHAEGKPGAGGPPRVAE